jgi:DNA-binding MarR family transcriptional regulator
VAENADLLQPRRGGDPPPPAAQFSVTLPRFDLLAQLDKAPDGLTLGETSRRMMVSNANVTTLVERLVADGLISRRADPSDRRTTYISLTPEGAARLPPWRGPTNSGSPNCSTISKATRSPR